MTYYTYFGTPIQPILLTSNGAGLTGLHMTERTHGPEIGTDWEENESIAPFPETKQQLAAYFNGTLTEFDLPLVPQGTEFQKKVWDELIKIPYGKTISYGQLAGRIGIPTASRAVGMANGRNPIGLIVPCHRVIGANGKLVGYGGGLPRKEALLSFEAAVLAEGPRAFEMRVGKVF